MDNLRLEVMKTIEPEVDGFIDKYLIETESIWQPTDLLPASETEEFFGELRELREEAKELSYDFWIVLIGDTITEEALPTYESWLMSVDGIRQVDEENNGLGNAWSRWVRHWTSEENRHGDTLNKYLYLSGRVNMKEVERSTQYLIADGFDIGTDHDPYRNFIYTSFQELATNISHKRVAQIAMKKGNELLGKMCNMIAGDEMRHYLAYREFMSLIFKYDANQAMLAFADMMKKKIVMPAHFVRETGESQGLAFEHFSNAAQRLGVYTSKDYVEIMNKLIKSWNIAELTELDDLGKKARDYVMALPDRLTRIAERIRIPAQSEVMSWVSPNGVMV